MAEISISYKDALRRINTWRAENDCTPLKRLPDLSLHWHCEECGFRYERRDLDGGRCWHCGTSITTPPTVTGAPEPEPTQRIYVLSWAPSYDEAPDGGCEWRRDWSEILDLLRDSTAITPGYDYRVTTLDLPASLGDGTITDFLGGRGTEVIDPPDPRAALADALGYSDDEEDGQ